MGVGLPQLPASTGSVPLRTINTLPRELLEHIFEDAGCAQCRISEYRETCRLPNTNVLAMVCSLWRDILIDSPALWRNIHVRGNEDWRQSYEDRILPRVLQHSKNADLNVTLDFARFGMDSRREPTRSLLPLFVECHRWRTLTIAKMVSQAKPSDTEFIFEALGQGSDSNLHRLKSVVIETLQDRRMSKTLQKAPSIQKLIVFITVHPNEHLQSDDNDRAYPALRTLVADPYTILSGTKQECWMNSVRTLQMEIDNRCHHPLPAHVIPFDFPSLEFLSIAVQRHPYNPIADSRYVESETELLPLVFPSFLNTLLLRIRNVPRLKTLRLGWTEAQEYRKDRAAPHLSLQSLLALVQQSSPTLVQLSIGNLFLAPTELQTLLNALPSLEVLQIQETNAGIVGVWASNPRIAMLTLPFLSFLTVRDIPDITVPLPRLRSVSFLFNEFHDEAFTSMVESRRKTDSTILNLTHIEVMLQGIGDLSKTRFYQEFHAFDFVAIRDRAGHAIP